MKFKLLSKKYKTQNFCFFPKNFFIFYFPTFFFGFQKNFLKSKFFIFYFFSFPKKIFIFQNFPIFYFYFLFSKNQKMFHETYFYKFITIICYIFCGTYGIAEAVIGISSFFLSSTKGENCYIQNIFLPISIYTWIIIDGSVTLFTLLLSLFTRHLFQKRKELIYSSFSPPSSTSSPFLLPLSFCISLSILFNSFMLFWNVFGGILIWYKNIPCKLEGFFPFISFILVLHYVSALLFLFDPYWRMKEYNFRQQNILNPGLGFNRFSNTTNSSFEERLLDFHYPQDPSAPPLTPPEQV